MNSSSSVQLPSAPPDLPADLIPRHIALVMDGNGRW
ncbi:MAG: isoprenyl transferase, partial [Corynebacterium kroppenstedtii]|nr:isoprenyl transferase [Corynebacterium kroppenstedtii]